MPMQYVTCSPSSRKPFPHNEIDGAASRVFATDGETLESMKPSTVFWAIVRRRSVRHCTL